MRERSWLLSPAADVLFVSNWTWPFLTALLVWVGRSTLPVGARIGLVYLTYVVSTPHRWVTLGLIGLDRQRQALRGPTLLWVGLGTTAFFAAVWGLTRSLAALIFVQYVWNLWHVVAQHVGVARIYAIKGQPERRTTGALEKWPLRLLAFYAFWRVWSMGVADYSSGQPLVFDWLRPYSLTTGRYDALLLAAPLALAVNEARRLDRRLLPKYLYLCSLCLHYGAAIVFCHFKLTEWAIAVSIVNGVFHAIEYLSIVTWSVAARSDKPDGWTLPYLFRNWAVTLALFVLSIATLGLAVSSSWAAAWILLNAFVAYQHYAYDAVIWKMPSLFKPAPATAV